MSCSHANNFECVECVNCIHVWVYPVYPSMCCMIGPGPHLIRGYLVSLESTLEMSLWSVRPFLYGSQLCLIHNRQTHRPCIIGSYRPYLMFCIAMWHNNTEFLLHSNMPSMLWRCWLGSRKGIWPVKNRVVGCWRGYLSGATCRLAYSPADATATHCLLLQ